MARPGLYDEHRVATAARLPATLRAELQAAAGAGDVSPNVVDRVIRDHLDRLPAAGDVPQ